MNFTRGHRNMFWLLIVLIWSVQLGDQAIWDWIRRFNAVAYFGLPNMDNVLQDTSRNDKAIGFGDAYPSVSYFRNWLPFLAILLFLIASVYYLLILWNERKKLDYFFIGLGLFALVLSYFAMAQVVMHS